MHLPASNQNKNIFGAEPLRKTADFLRLDKG